MPKRSKFSLSHTKLFTHDMGQLIPIGLVPVLQGDTIQHSTTALLRCSPLLTPVMHPVDVYIHHVYVPHRLVWEDFEDFITGGEDNDSLPTFPTITTPASTGFAVKSLHDYLGVPTGVASRPISALPARGYALIWNEIFRDQDLQSKLTLSVASGADTTTNVDLQNAAWGKDYLTNARPWEAKGPAITIPLGTAARINSDAAADSDLAIWSTVQGGGSYREMRSDTTRVAQSTDAGTQANRLYADLTTASAITIPALREALALQRAAEMRARYGSRFVEYLRSQGVRSSDARLQRPEYLGGSRQRIQFTEVLQTGEGDDPVGTLRGHGIAAMRSNRYRRFFEEPGYVFSLMTVRPLAMYIDGLDRHWNWRLKEDMWQPELQHIGQQEVLNKEVRFAHATPDGVFGYSDRYAELRGVNSTIAGEFRSSLNMWHFGRAFGSDPALNADFIKCVPSEAPFAVNSANVLWSCAKHSIQARRLVSASTASFIR